MTNPLLEKLAELEHTQWKTWTENLTLREHLSEDTLTRWKSLWIPYPELPEEAKERDREWARMVLEIIHQALGSEEKK